ncbi:MAG: Crp/Fnr family transcriptional regulator [Clostridia bacterium]|nr:Crp/Fnr family transcriptional regulator [Clostridia bacterium]
MKKYFDILQTCPLFTGIGEEDLAALLDCLGARVVHYTKRETVMAEGEAATHIGILLFGGLQIEQVDYFGNRSILSGVEPGEVFAESFACAGAAAIPVSVVAGEDSAVMRIECTRILHSCHNACDFHRQLLFNLMKVLATKNIRFHQKTQITSKRTTREKLMAYLLLEAKKHNSRRFVIPFDRQELADYLEVERSGLSAEIGKLRKEGVLKSRKNQFELL